MLRRHATPLDMAIYLRLRPLFLGFAAVYFVPIDIFSFTSLRWPCFSSFRCFLRRYCHAAFARCRFISLSIFAAATIIAGTYCFAAAATSYAAVSRRRFATPF